MDFRSAKDPWIAIYRYFSRNIDELPKSVSTSLGENHDSVARGSAADQRYPANWYVRNAVDPEFRLTAEFSPTFYVLVCSYGTT